MKKIISISLIFFTGLSLNATRVHVATTGDNTTGNGTIGNPYLTVAKAMSEASTGDTVFAHNGVYTFGSQINWPEGISLMGEGMETIFRGTAALAPIFMLSSPSQGTMGNQTISHIYFDGNDSIAHGAIRIMGRSNIQVHDCYFINFRNYAVLWLASAVNQGEPDIYATGNAFRRNTIIDCARDAFSTYYFHATGAFHFAGQAGMIIEDNVINGGVRYGYGIKSVEHDGHHHGTIIRRNKIKVNYRDTPTTSWDFAIELWSQKGGIQIYDNEIEGGVDISGFDTTDEYGYGFAAKVLNNHIYSQNPTIKNTRAICLEKGQSGGVEIARNLIHGFESGVVCNNFTTGVAMGQSDISITYNIFYNMGRVTESRAGRIVSFDVAYDSISFWTNILFANNVAFSLPGPGGTTVMDCDDPNSLNIFTNIVFRNNIVGGYYNGVKFDRGTVNGLSVENNIYQDITRLTKLDGASLTLLNDVIQNNYNVDPMFINAGENNYELQSGSPAINAGINVGLDKDFRGWSIVGLPDIGAYEYGATAPAVGFLKDASNVMLRSVEGTFMRIE